MSKKKNPTKLPMPPKPVSPGRRPGTTTSTGEKNPRPAKPGKPWVPSKLSPKDGLPSPKHEPSVFRPAKSSGDSADPGWRKQMQQDASTGKPIRYRGCQRGDGGKKK